MSRIIKKCVSRQEAAQEAAIDQDGLVENMGCDGRPEMPEPDDNQSDLTDATIDVHAVDVTDDSSDVTAISEAIDGTVDRQQDDAAESGPEFSPLVCSLAPETEIPAQAFGPMILAWATAMAKLSRAPLAMCLVTILGFLNLAVQGYVDLMFFGSPTPISLFIFVVGSSGSGKSSLFRRLVRPVNRFEEKLRYQYEEAKLARAGDEDSEPRLLPDVYFDESTPAALNSVLTRCRGVLSLITDEAAKFLGSHGMMRESHQDMIGNLSKLSDAMPVKVFRKAEGTIHVTGKRFSLILMGQWMIARDFLMDPINRRQGVMSRIMVCYPDLVKDRNKTSEAEEADAIGVMEGYDEHMADWLGRPLPVAEGTANRLVPPVLSIPPEARALFDSYDAEVGGLMNNAGPDGELRDFLNKMPNMSLRIAATLQLIEGSTSRNLEPEFVVRGIDIARYFAAEAQRLYLPPPVIANCDSAKLLLDMLRDKGMTEFSRTWCYKQGPHSLRTKRALQPVISILLDYGWVTEHELPKKKGAAKAMKIYRLTRAARREIGMLP